MPDLAPIRRELLVDAAPDVAFAVFTDGIDRWWPLPAFSVLGGGTVAFTGGALVETGASGETALWGTVTAWDPPGLVAFTWHPGGAPDGATLVTVTFAPADAGARTLVTLVHEGWERVADPAVRDEYVGGWPVVLEPLRALVETLEQPRGGGGVPRSGRRPGA